MALPAEGYQLKGISPRAYEHPADRAATAALKAIPYVDSTVRRVIEYGYERALRRGVLGSAVRLGENQLPHVYGAHVRAYATLDMDAVPELYITQYPMANASTIGSAQPIVVVNSEMIRLLDVEQLRAVFAHEAAHVLSDHVLYHTALVILMRLSILPGIPVPLFPLRTALMEWFRASELTCDRAAALVTRDPLAVCRTLMVLSAGAEAPNLDLDVFMAQGRDYREKASPFDRLSRLLSDLSLTHPMSVQRVHELIEWIQSGDYDRIVGGEYAVRGEPTSVRAEASDAVTHYSERLLDTFKELGDSVEEAAKQLSDWLRRDRDGDGDEP
jgi:Zn-dependent protease with chaperone function